MAGDAATAAFHRWRLSHAAARRAVLLGIAEQIAAHMQELAALLVNEHCALDPAVAFLTFKQSGVRVESGRAGLLEHTAPKMIHINTA